MSVTDFGIWAVFLSGIFYGSDSWFFEKIFQKILESLKKIMYKKAPQRTLLYRHDAFFSRTNNKLEMLNSPPFPHSASASAGLKCLQRMPFSVSSLVPHYGYPAGGD